MSKASFKITANKEDITKVLSDYLLSLRVSDKSGTQSDTVEFRLDDREQRLIIPERGVELEVYLGFESDLVFMGIYTVDEVELDYPPGSLTIRAKAADMLASLKAQKTAYWHEKSIADIVNTIAAYHGLEAKVDNTLGQIKIAHMDQTNESDINFLLRLAKQYDAVTKPVNGLLVFTQRGDGKSVTGQELPKINLQAHDVNSYRVTLADRNRYKSVTAYWYDMDDGKLVKETEGKGEPVYAFHHTFPTKDEAQDAAESQLKELNKSVSKLSFDMPGNMTVMAGAKLTISNFRQGVDGSWDIISVEHEFSDSGLLTRVEAEQ